MTADNQLTPEEQELLRRNITIDGDGNVVGTNNDVQITKLSAGDYAVQIGEQRYTINIVGGIHLYPTLPRRTRTELDSRKAAAIVTLVLIVIGLIIASFILGVWEGPFTPVTPTLTPTVTLTPTPTPLAAPELGKILFSDDFYADQPELNWNRESGDLIHGGRVRFVDNTMEIYAAQWDRLRNWKNYIIDKSCTQCSIQVDAEAVEEDPPRGAGIVFGLTSSDSYYQVVLKGADGTFNEWAVLEASPPDYPEKLNYILDPTLLAHTSPVKGKFTLRVDLDVQGEQPLATCYLNGGKLGSVVLPEYSGGNVGVVTSGSVGESGTVRFDNFKVAQYGETSD